MIRIALSFVVVVWAGFPAYSDVAIQDVTTPSGINAWLVEEHSLPFTALEIRFRGGSSLDRSGKRGAVSLMTALLEEGAQDKDAQAFAAAAERLAASFWFDAYDDSISVSAQFLSENRNEAIALLHGALTEPRFDKLAIDRVRTQTESYLESHKQDPHEIAFETWNRLAFKDHPYGSMNLGTAESLSNITRADLMNAFQDAIALDRIYVAAVGDISPAELSDVLETLFEGLPKSGADLPERVEFGQGGGVTHVAFDTPQSIAVFGHAGIGMDAPDFFAAYIVNEILGGGGLNSRLMNEVREKRGLTYGISSSLVLRDLSETVQGQFSSQTGSMEEALDVVREEWAKMARDGITREELIRAQTYLTGAYPLRFDGNSTIANIMVSMQKSDLSIEYISSRNDKILAVTLDDANRVAARLFRPDDLYIVVVGTDEGAAEK